MVYLLPKRMRTKRHLTCMAAPGNNAMLLISYAIIIAERLSVSLASPEVGLVNEKECYLLYLW